MKVITPCLLLLAAVTSAQAQALWSLAAQGDVAVVGQVASVETESATLIITAVLAGSLDAKIVSVSPIYFLLDDVSGPHLTFAVGDEVIVFGKLKEGNKIAMVQGGRSGSGKVALTPQTRLIILAAAKREIEIVALKDERSRNDAMLTEVKSSNERLRADALQYIASSIGNSTIRDSYRDQLITLLGDPGIDVQRAALEAIRFVKAPEAVPFLVKLIRSPNRDIVEAASMVLGQYDGAESVAALITLTENQDPQVRIRACIDLQYSERPEAKAALMRLLSDKNDYVRALAPVGLVQWIRREKASDCLPKLVEMLNDPIPAVRVSSARMLGETRSSDVVPPLLRLLAQKSLDVETERGVLGALYQLLGNFDSGPRARVLIDESIDLVIAVLKRGASNPNAGSMSAVGILGRVII